MELKRIGVYEIVARIGVGGMGEVYRAKDTRLGRDVAIKVLPSELPADPDRLARFEREAQILAAVNHPNIAAIHGVDDSTGTPALVMELVEGPTLADRIAKGPIPLDETLPIAKQIADALEAAHEQGIIHRDLKPANVKVRPDGTVKVLDFGLAKAFEPAAVGVGNATMSPTLSIHGTQAGIILGTAAYMAPEQARGKTVDRRADIWAFGCVLYETLSGRRLFAGDDIADVLAAVLRQDIDGSSLPADTPSRLRRLIARCLDRDVKTRLRDIGEARVELAMIMSGAPDSAGITASMPAAPARSRERLAWIVVVAALFAALLLVIVRRSSQPLEAAPLVRLPFVTPADANLTDIASVIVSPDGRQLLFSARPANGRRQLWLRPLDSMDVTALPDTDDAIEPFWSPDSASIAFGAQGKLKRLDLGDARARVIADAARLNNGTWNRNGIIVFSPDYGSPLFKVKSIGGERSITTPAGGDDRYPQFLPDGRHFLFNAGQVGSIDAPEMNKAVLTDSSGGAIYAAPGVLLYIRNGTVVAHPFDMDRLELTGQPIPIAAASANDPWARARLSASDAGVLVVQNARYYDYQLAWFDRAGKPDGVLGPVRPHVLVSERPRVSPDGRHVAVQRTERNDAVAGRDLWIGDLARGTFDRLTTGEPFQQLPVWSHDGRYIICSIGGQATAGIYGVPVGGGVKTLILRGTVFPADVSPDGKWLIYLQRGVTTRNDIWMLPLADGKAAGEPHVIINSPYEDVDPRVAPNGRWLAYTSDQSGINEIYVRSLGPDGRVGSATRVSSGGGLEPVWARDGRELYFLAPIAGDVRMQLTALPVRTDGATFEFDTTMARAKVSIVNPEGSLTASGDYDVTPEGRVLVGMATPDTRASPATIVLNWMHALKK